MQDRLEGIDRATLGFWRATNVLAWSALAIVVGVVIHQSWVHLVPRVTRGWLNGSFLFSLNERQNASQYTTWFVLPKYFAKAIGEVLIGFAIGGIVGAKVWKKQWLVAAGAALGYVLFTVVRLEYATRFLPLEQTAGGGQASIGVTTRGLGGTGWSGVVYDLVGIVAIVTAALWARHVARRHV